MKEKKIGQMISEANIVTIFRHVGPDGDAYGSQVGLKELIKTNYPNIQVYCVGEPHNKWAQICGPLDEVSDETISNSLAIVLDVSTVARVDDQRFLNASKMIKIDHHIFTEHFGDLEMVVEEASSTCELIVRLAMANKWNISKLGATALYLGLTTDAGRFLYSYTPKLFDCAKWLVKHGADVATIYPLIYEQSVKSTKFHGFCQSNFTLTPYGVGYNKIYPEIAEKYGVSAQHGAGVVNSLANIQGVDIWVHFSETDEGTIRTELRSKGIPVNTVAAEFGGGGHKQAAGATLLNWDEVDVMLKRLEEVAFDNKPYSSELKVALRIAKEASDIAREGYLKQGFSIEIKDDDSPVTEVDKRCDTFIRNELLKVYPDHGLLSEETSDDLSRLDKDYVWIIDPIDGTKDFIAHDDEFSINIALAYKHEIVVGVLVVPMKNTIYYATKGGGSFKEEDGVISKIAVSDSLTDLVALRSHFHNLEVEEKFLKQYESLITSYKQVGSAYKAGLIAEGKAHVCLKLGAGTKEWDIAPCVLIVREAGGSFTKADGSEIIFNRENVRNLGGYVILNKPNKEFFATAKKLGEKVCG